MRKILKPLVAASVLAGLLLPFAPAQAQWVLVARKALGRIHQMTEGNQPNGRAGYDFATVLLDLPTRSSPRRWNSRARTRRCASLCRIPGSVGSRSPRATGPRR